MVSVNNLRNYVVINLNNIYYYAAMDGTLGLYIFDLNWQFQKWISLSSLGKYLDFFMVIYDVFYFGSSTSILKGYLNLTITATYGFSPRQMVYSNASNTFYAAGSSVLYEFDQNLVLVNRINLPHVSHSVNVYGSQIFVGYWDSNVISVIENGVVIQNFPTLCTKYLVNLQIDAYGYIAASCLFTQVVYLYTINGTYMNLSIPVTNAFFTGIDLNNNLVLGSLNTIYVYS